MRYYINLNQRTILVLPFIGSTLIFVFILILYWYFLNSFMISFVNFCLNYATYGIIIITPVIILLDYIFQFKEKNLLNYYLMGINLMIISSIILFMELINHPELSYLNVFYILLGTLLVSFIDKVINRNENEKKIIETSKRIILASRNDIELNISIVESNLVAIKQSRKPDPSLECHSFEIEPLNTDFWDLISSNIADIKIENEVFQKFLLIKNRAETINKRIAQRKSMIDNFTSNNTYEVKKHVIKLFKMSSNIGTMMKLFKIDLESVKEQLNYLDK